MLTYDTGFFDFTEGLKVGSGIILQTGHESNLFTAKALRFTWTGINFVNASSGSSATSINRGVGFASSATSRACVSSFSAHNSASADTGSAWSNTSCVTVISGSGTLWGQVDVSGIEKGKVTLIVDRALPASLNYRVLWEAWGGSDITNVTIGAIAEPAAIGQQTYVASGFEPRILTASNSLLTDQCIMFAGVQSVSNTDTVEQQDSGLCMGFLTNPTTWNNLDFVYQNNGLVLCINSDDGSATMDTDAHLSNDGDCLAMITIGGGAINARASGMFHTDNNFRLNWLARATTNRRSIYMAIKGGIWQGRMASINSTTLNSVSTLGPDIFATYRGASFFGVENATVSAGATHTNDQLGYGVCRIGLGNTNYTNSDLGLYEASIGCVDTDGLATSRCEAHYIQGASLSYTNGTNATIASQYQVMKIGEGGLKLKTTAASGSSTIEGIGILVFGDSAPRATSFGHPFIV